MNFAFIRTLFVLVSMVVGFQMGSGYGGYVSMWGFIGTVAGGGVAGFVILLESGMGKLSLRGLSAAVFGLILALIVSHFLSRTIDLIPDLSPYIASTLKLALVIILCYIGMVFAIRGRDEFNLIVPYVKFERQDQKDALLILDTSVIIDGRVIDVCQTRFLEGRFVVPQFVLKELQQVADSADPLKRNRGRRGLEILNKLKKIPSTQFKIHDEDFPEIHSVDEKLVKLAKVLSAKILTNDFNLNKVAELQGVVILNLNDLVNALRPVVFPGEMLEVRLVREGKELNQALAYMDDGTMIVVDNGKKYIGKTVTASVTSVLQTAAGRMIFAKTE